ncbi:MAG: hypothetical protein H6815_05305 [Phycisphaeraceae bacterium]|nr:hypothetical protein [Phycisphaerales bacterium]MCB9859854.1 hypothetical protein [Phycisphaeraceae bacterium]
MVATDRDLLAVEPNVFRDIAWVGQRLTNGTGSITSNVLTQLSSFYDVSFEDAGVGAGHVVLHGGIAYEVIDRTSSTSVSVSRLRASTDDAAIVVGDVSNALTTVYTFRPQIQLVTNQVYRLLGLVPAGLGLVGTEVTVDDLYDTDDLKQAVVMGTLHMAYSAASALSSEGSPLLQRAELYRRLFSLERERAVVRFDADGDGEPEFTRRMNMMRFERV